jgi:hypothetical protein
MPLFSKVTSEDVFRNLSLASNDSRLFFSLQESLAKTKSSSPQTIEGMRLTKTLVLKSPLCNPTVALKQAT